MAQLADYRTATQALGYSLSDTVLDVAIQQARRRIFQDRRWSFLDDTNTTLATSANVDTLALSTITDMLHIDAVRFVDNPPPYYVEPPAMRNLQDLNPSTGVPQAWTRRGSEIVFWPTPDQALTVRIDHVNYPGDLADATDDILPSQYQDLVTWAAAVPLGYRINDFQKSAAADQFYTRVLLPRFASQDDTVQRQTPRRIKTGYWQGRR